MTKWIKAGQKGDNVEILTVDVMLMRGYDYNYRNNIRVPGGLNVTKFRQYDGVRWVGQADVDDYLVEVKKREAKDSRFLLKSFLIYAQKLTKLEQFADGFKKVKPKKLSATAMTSLINQMNARMIALNPYIYNYVILNKSLPNRLIKVIGKKVKDFNKQTRYFEILTSAKKLSKFRLSQESLLKIVQKRLPKNSPVLEHLVNSWLDKFSFLGFFYFHGRPLTRNDVFKRLNDLSKKDIKKELALITEQKKYSTLVPKLIRQLEFNGYEKVLVQTLRQMTFCTNSFDETCQYAIGRMFDFWNEVGNRIGLTFSQLSWLLIREIINLLKKNKKASREFKREIIIRRKDHALIWQKGKTYLKTDVELKKYRQTQPRERINRQIKVVKGQSASPGRAEGMVKVVMSTSELDKVKKGDILVAATTTPTHVPAMERAAAVITDEGGLLCHAAIVSREMRIPCVVGTISATKILKDGDQVEVDANKGIVKRIK